jgi:beta-phosphoglucomutase-like phosphatase (HAD superfamily)
VTTLVDGLPLPAAVLFDLDGTLVDTVETRISAWEQALANAGLSTGRDRIAPLIGLDGKRLASEIAALAGRPIDDARAEEIDRESGEIYERLNLAPGHSPGWPARCQFGRRGIRWAIATSSRKDQVGRRWMRSLTASRRSSMPATSSTRSPSPTSPLLAAEQLDRACRVLASATQPGTWFRRGCRHDRHRGDRWSAVDAATLRGAGGGVVGTLDEIARSSRLASAASAGPRPAATPPCSAPGVDPSTSANAATARHPQRLRGSRAPRLAAAAVFAADPSASVMAFRALGRIRRRDRACRLLPQRWLRPRRPPCPGGRRQRPLRDAPFLSASVTLGLRSSLIGPSFAEFGTLQDCAVRRDCFQDDGGTR